MATVGADADGRSVGRRLTCAGVMVLVLSAVGLSWAVRPDARGHGTHERLGLAPCAFRTLTGLPCPMCGLTTSVCHLVRSEWREAIRAHPAGPPVLAMGIVAGAGSAVVAVGRDNRVVRRVCVHAVLGLGLVSASVALLWWLWQLSLRASW